MKDDLIKAMIEASPERAANLDEQGRPIPTDGPPIQMTEGPVIGFLPALDTPKGTGSVPVHEELGASYMSISHSYDAAGTLFLTVPNSLVTNTNITWIELYQVPAGGTFPPRPNQRIDPVKKLDGVSISHTGDVLSFAAITHAPGPGLRPISIEMAGIPGLFHTTRAFELEEGGAGGFTGGEGLPGGDMGVTLEELNTALSAHLGGTSAQDSLVNKITAGHSSMRTALRNLAQEGAESALANVANIAVHDTDPEARAFQDGMFQFVKNADAGVLRNVLQPPDQWNRDTKELFEQMIAEAVARQGVQPEEPKA